MLIAGLVCSALGLLCGFLDLVIFLAVASQEAEPRCQHYQCPINWCTSRAENWHMAPEALK